MAQNVSVSLVGPGFTCNLLVSGTDDAWTELVDVVDSLSLFKVAQGRQFHSIMGWYTAGGGIVRIRNLKNNQIKMLEGLTMPKGVHTKPLDFGPVTIQDGDILEAFVTVAGS